MLPLCCPPAATHPFFRKQFVSLRSSNDAVRAAAIEAAGDLTASQRMLEMAAESPPLLSALIDLWEGITDALPGELNWGAVPAWGSYAVCRCCALGTGNITFLLPSTSSSLLPSNPCKPLPGVHLTPLQTIPTWSVPAPAVRWHSCSKQTMPPGHPCPMPLPPCSQICPTACTSGLGRCWGSRWRGSGGWSRFDSTCGGV
jgi:hypothetical protein